MTRRIPEPRRRAKQAEAVIRYKDGASIRAIAAKTGLAYSTVRGLLLEAGVKLRDKSSGDRRSPAARARAGATGA